MGTIARLNQIAAPGIAHLNEQGFEVEEACAAPDALLLRSYKLGKDEIPPSVLAVARAGVGVNNIPVDYCTRRGVPVFNTPGGNANAVKELVLASLLLASRGIFEGLRYVETLGDISDPAAMDKKMEAEKKQFKGVELRGRTLGVIGLGSVGVRVTEIGLLLGMRVLGYDPAISLENAWRLSRDVERCESLRSLVGASDYVSLHVPALPSTRAMINAELLESFKKGGCLFNFARTEVVDNGAVLAALDKGSLGKYITDFPHPDFTARPKILQMPHIGASTAEAEENCAVMAARQLGDFLKTGQIVNSVNFPNLRLEPQSKYRLALSNANMPKMLNSILSVLGDSNINVADMSNRSRGDIAYNLIDVEQPPGEEITAALSRLEGVTGVRLLTL